MACDRIERILQAVLNTQKMPGSAEDLARNRRRVPSHDQNAHGEVEGIVFLDW
jgi:hypothetical protein